MQAAAINPTVAHVYFPCVVRSVQVSMHEYLHGVGANIAAGHTGVDLPEFRTLVVELAETRHVPILKPLGAHSGRVPGTDPSSGKHQQLNAQRGVYLGFNYTDVGTHRRVLAYGGHQPDFGGSSRQSIARC